MAHISELRMKNRWKYEQNKQNSKHINTHQTGSSLVSSDSSLEFEIYILLNYILWKLELHCFDGKIGFF